MLDLFYDLFWTLASCRFRVSWGFFLLNLVHTSLFEPLLTHCLMSIHYLFCAIFLPSFHIFPYFSLFMPLTYFDCCQPFSLKFCFLSFRWSQYSSYGYLFDFHLLTYHCDGQIHWIHLLLPFNFVNPLYKTTYQMNTYINSDVLAAILLGHFDTTVRC